jgi:hypothetical protein
MIALLALLLAAQPGTHDERQTTDLLDFRYAWPAEAQAIPALRNELRRRSVEAQADAVAGAVESRESAGGAQVPFHKEQYHQIWSVEANNTLLLSLTADIRTDNNGAHPNRDFEALIWDRAQGRATSAAAVLGPSALAAMSGRYCAALADQAAARGAGPPERCPPLAERVLSFSDADHDGRFDALHVLIAPYVAASYADGSFVVDVPFEGADLAGVGARYRPAFESR